jgi:hypothetical protein
MPADLCFRTLDSDVIHHRGMQATRVHLSSLTKPLGEFLFTGTEPRFVLMAIALDGIKDVSQHKGGKRWQSVVSRTVKIGLSLDLNRQT